ncbi:hypothetical protein CL646_03505 [bacterium]|nr:hypothetical protein [bacterium]|tara:strand:+ start:361 stop:579 length:219 start_codon:yes stop_codon:yes gene_type:complete
MIKYLLGAILALAIIGGAFKFESDDNSWKLIILKEEAFYSVTNGAKRIFNIVANMIPNSELSNASSIVIGED